MDIYKKEIIRKLLFSLAFILGIYLQWTGRKINGINGLLIQFLSIAILLTVLYLYNRRFR